MATTVTNRVKQKQMAPVFSGLARRSVRVTEQIGGSVHREDPTVTDAATDTRTLIIDAARRRLLADGNAGLSTRKVAEAAGVPLSQLHYHVGSKGGLMADRAALRHELGYHPDEQVCIVPVGGSRVGEALLRRVIAAYPEAKRRAPALRMIVVAGPASTRPPSRATTGWRSARSSTGSAATWPPATWPWSRAA